MSSRSGRDASPSSKEMPKRVVRMSLEPELISAVDRMAKQLKITRTGFARLALRQALKQCCDRTLEARHREGYARHPETARENAGWEAGQVWPQ